MQTERVPFSARRLAALLWLSSAAFILYGGTIPFNFAADHAGFGIRLRQFLETTPWQLFAGRGLSMADVVQNILLFMPFGALGVLTRREGGRVGVVRNVLLVTMLGVLLSVVIEGIQLFTSDRVASLTDIATNTLGAAAGAACAVALGKTALGLLRRLASAELLHPTTFYPMMIFLLVVCISSWEPFDVTLDVGTVGHKIRLLQRDIWQFSGLDDEGIAAIYFILFAGSVCSWLRAAGLASSAAGTGLIVGLVTACGLEVSQLLITSRQPGLEDAAVRAIGAAAGVGLWRISGPGSTARWRLPALALATAAGAALQMLSPFEMSARYRAIQWVPFLSYYQVTTVNTVSHAIELALIYFPLGFVAGRDAATARTGAGTAVLLSALIAAPIEYGQGWIVGRYADITDVALSAAGGLLGAWAATSGADAFAHLVDTLNATSRCALTSDHSTSSNVAT